MILVNIECSHHWSLEVGRPEDRQNMSISYDLVI